MGTNPNTYPNMIDQSVEDARANGATVEHATEFKGRVSSASTNVLKNTNPDDAREVGKGWDTASAANEFNRGETAILRKIRETVPDYNQAKSHNIAHAVAEDQRDLAAAIEARKDDRFVKIKREDGSSEQGIIKPDTNGNPQRQGLWVATDSSGHVRQVATFEDGKAQGESRTYDESGKMMARGTYEHGVPQGTHYAYNDKAQVIHRTTYDEKGKVTVDQDVDPKAAEEQRRQMQLSKQMTFGR